jgi:hypothetical protein
MKNLKERQPAKVVVDVLKPCIITGQILAGESRFA